MFVRGQRVELDLNDGSAEDTTPETGRVDTGSIFSTIVGDIQERNSDKTTSIPQAPSLRGAENGFPRQLSSRGRSRFAQKSKNKADAGIALGDIAPISHSDISSETGEKRLISAENQRMLDEMSNDEILQSREDLLESLTPSLLKAFLRHAKLDNVGGEERKDLPVSREEEPDTPVKKAREKKRVAFVAGDIEHSEKSKVMSDEIINPDSSMLMKERSSPEDKVQQIENEKTKETETFASNVHFPRPAQPPDLDPSSASFLEDLHSKYFPMLPADPEKLEWMKPIDKGSGSYSPSQSGLDPKDIRFSFSGALIPPSEAAEISVTKGLHHHGDAPDAAGYTIPELAILMRSRVASQRCISFQTAGRILYRLGKGEFGNPSDGSAGTVGAQSSLGELARGLWSEVEKERLIDLCTAESEGKSIVGGKHVSAQSYATEAIWLWQKGGGRRWKTN